MKTSATLFIASRAFVILALGASGAVAQDGPSVIEDYQAAKAIEWLASHPAASEPRATQTARSFRMQVTPPVENAEVFGGDGSAAN